MDSMHRYGNIYGSQFGTGYAGNVYDIEGLCPSLMTMQGGQREPMIIIKTKKEKVLIVEDKENK